MLALRACGVHLDHGEPDKPSAAAHLAPVHLPLHSSNRVAPKQIAKFVLIMSGCAGDSHRYRVEHQAEALRLMGLTVDTATYDRVDYGAILDQYRLFILHRVPYTPAVEELIHRATDAGKPVLFDVDDLVFNEKIAGDIKALRDFAPNERALYIDGMLRYKRTLSLSSASTVTTESLRMAILSLFPDVPVAVVRNFVSDEMVRLANEALALPAEADRCIRIAYFSGTRTHQQDFAECAPALARVLNDNAQTRLMIVGPLDIPEELKPVRRQIEVVPFVPWRELPQLIRRVAINLAPLELNNAFTDCKSELKYFEAGLLGVATVASDVSAFRTAIQPGDNGFLCKTDDDWFSVLNRLVGDPVLCEQVGARAREDVLRRYTSRSRAPALARALKEIVSSHFPAASCTLSIAFVLRAPIAKTGGGYKTIFSLAHHLAGRGHQVNLYLERIAHLQGMPDGSIREFCYQHFGRSAAQIHIGHEHIPASDVAIATNWPTAYTVNELENTHCKMYLVQDFEPDFYDRSDPNYRSAESTYDLPLRKVTIGTYLADLISRRDQLPAAHFNFSLDREPFRNRHVRPVAPPVRILFFARPGLKRRAYPVGVEALRRVSATSPGVQISFYGSAIKEELGFEYDNLGELTREEVARQMNQHHIHLSFSLTNTSWVPLEAMACGCAVVEARVPSMQAWAGEQAPGCVLADPEPQAVANALQSLITDNFLRERTAHIGEQLVPAISGGWRDIGEQFEGILLDAVLRPERAFSARLP